MDDPTDMALGVSAAVAMAVCAICVGVNAWRSSRWPPRPFGGIKESRSDTDLTNMLENAIPSASAARRLTPPDDPAPDTP
jgi:hypothetical protein